jgi:2-dehydropantoate 2-reductase
VTRFVIYGAGAIGATLGAALHGGGFEVALIARGPHYEALASGGLRFETPDSSETLQLPVVDHPSKLEIGEEDVVVLAMKGQHTGDALQSLAAVAPPSTHVVCAQNGVENERAALRLFRHVHAMCVMCPATHLAPGVVAAHSSPVLGAFDIGTFPGGTDSTDELVAQALEASRCESIPRSDVMAWKYAKLLRNLRNGVEALFGRGDDHAGLTSRARGEALACFAAAGIEVVDDETFIERHGNVVSRPPKHISPDGPGRQGGSSWQSLARGTGSIESDYLNGEIALLGRLYDIPTPVNELLQELADGLARNGGEPGSMTEDDFYRRLEALEVKAGRSAGA